MQIYDELVARGLIAQVTDEKEIRDLVNNGKATFYIGFDPTADSLHVGHFMALCHNSQHGGHGRRHPQHPHVTFFSLFVLPAAQQEVERLIKISTKYYMLRLFPSKYRKS